MQHCLAPLQGVGGWRNVPEGQPPTPCRTRGASCRMAHTYDACRGLGHTAGRILQVLYYDRLLSHVAAATWHLQHCLAPLQGVGGWRNVPEGQPPTPCRMTHTCGACRGLGHTAGRILQVLYYNRLLSHVAAATWHLQHCLATLQGVGGWRNEPEEQPNTPCRTRGRRHTYEAVVTQGLLRLGHTGIGRILLLKCFIL